MANVGKVGEKKLSRREENWLKETRLRLGTLRQLTDPGERELAIEDLEDSLVRMAKEYRIDGSGRTSEGWTRLLSHLSTWSGRSPLADGLEACSAILLRLAMASKGRPHSGNSLLPTPPFGPAQQGHILGSSKDTGAPCSRVDTQHAPPVRKTVISSGRAKEAQQVREVPREVPVMRTSTPQVDVPHKKTTSVASSPGL